MFYAIFNIKKKIENYPFTYWLKMGGGEGVWIFF